MKIFPLFISVALALSVAQKETDDYECALLAEAGLEIPLPEDWHFQEEPSRVILFSSDFQSRILFSVSELQVPGENSQALTEEISKTFEHPEITMISGSEKINDFLIYSAQGVGVRNSEIEEWTLRFIAGARKSVLAFAVGETAEEKIGQVLSELRMKEIEVREEEIEDQEQTPPTEN